MSYSSEIVAQIRAADFSDAAVTVVGYGHMGREYVKALRALKVGRIRVCSRSGAPLEILKGEKNISLCPGGYSRLETAADPSEPAILSTPTADLIPAARHLRGLGFKKFLIEKPIAFTSKEIESFASEFSADFDVACAYNRIAYPPLLEAESLCRQEGGITSATYTFTEFTNRIHPGDYPEPEMRRWGVANSLHVVSMAHRLIGLPKTWKCHVSGSAVEWHPAGSTFVGSGISEKNIPFSYHADWGSMGRWSVEVHTHRGAYRFCPLEKLFRKENPLGEWGEIPVDFLAPEVKTGFVEQAAAILRPELRRSIPLLSLGETIRLTRFGEEVFGYV